MTPQWEGFEPGLWQNEIDVRDFIQQNYAPYEGDESFLAPATPADEVPSSLTRGRDRNRERPRFFV